MTDRRMEGGCTHTHVTLVYNKLSPMPYSSSGQAGLALFGQLDCRVVMYSWPIISPEKPGNFAESILYLLCFS